jgi:hypothetical protein
MNVDLIKSFADQSYVQQKTEWSETPVRYFDYYKFAELIVKECADICINENHSMVDVSLLVEGTASQIQEAATISCGEELAIRLKQRFGVK